MKQRTVMIGLHIDDKIIDLKIPIDVTVKRLEELLREALGLLSIHLPQDYRLLFKNKSLVLSETALVSDYPIGNGDQLVVVQIQN